MVVRRRRAGDGATAGGGGEVSLSSLDKATKALWRQTPIKPLGQQGQTAAILSNSSEFVLLAYGMLLVFRFVELILINALSIRFLYILIALVQKRPGWRRQ